MAHELVTQTDVEAVLLEPLTENQALRLSVLLDQVSDMLRTRRRNIDQRIELWTTDPTNPQAVSPRVVAGMLATAIKRVLVNPRGLWSTSETEADYSYSETYPGQRAGANAGTPGELELTAADLAKIAVVGARCGSIHVQSQPYLAARTSTFRR